MQGLVKSFVIVLKVKDRTTFVNLVNIGQQIVLPVKVLIDGSLDNSFGSSIHLRRVGKTEVVNELEAVTSFVKVK